MINEKCDKPFFSIITVCYNAGESLKYTVESVRNQSFTNWELIIKDGCSKDGSIDNINTSDIRIKTIIESDSGIYNAMNRALIEASGNYFIFLNAGDLFADENVLERVYEFQILHEADIYYGNYLNSLGEYCVMPPKISYEFMYRSFLCHQSVFYKKNRLLHYDEDYRLLADHDLNLLLLSNKKEFVRIPLAICIYEGGGVSENPKYKAIYDREKTKIRKKYYTLKERIVFQISYMLTLPHLRAMMYGDHSPLLVRKIYRRIAAFFRRK